MQIMFYVKIKNLPNQTQKFEIEEEAIAYWNDLNEENNAGCDPYELVDGKAISLFSEEEIEIEE